MEGTAEPFSTCYHGHPSMRKDLYLPTIRRGELQACGIYQFYQAEKEERSLL